MANSRCPRCPGTSFEIVEARINGAKSKYFFIQCSHCGCVVGVQLLR